MSNIWKKRKSRYELAKSKHMKHIDIKSLMDEVIAKYAPDILSSLPPVVFLHQLYGIGGNKSAIDKEICQLKKDGRIIAFNLDAGNEERSVAFVETTEISSHIKRYEHSDIVKNYVDNILPRIGSSAIPKDALMTRFDLSENALKELVQGNVLSIRDVGSYWLRFPKSGEFLRSYLAGRYFVLMCINRAKYGELLESDLKQRKMPPRATLGVDYHICDSLGANDIECIETTSGRAFKLKK